MRIVCSFFAFYCGFLIGAASITEGVPIDEVPPFAVIHERAGLPGVKVIAKCFAEERMALFAVMDDDIPFWQPRTDEKTVADYMSCYLPTEVKRLAKTKQQPVQLLREALRNVNQICIKRVADKQEPIVQLYNMQLLFIYKKNVFLLHHFDRGQDSFVPLFDHRSSCWLSCNTDDWNPERIVYMALSMRELKRSISARVQHEMLNCMDLQKVAKKIAEDMKLGAVILLALHNWDAQAIGHEGFCMASAEE